MVDPARRKESDLSEPALRRRAIRETVASIPLLIGAVAGLYLAFARLDFEAMSVVLVVAGLLWQVLRFTLKRILRQENASAVRAIHGLA